MSFELRRGARQVDMPPKPKQFVTRDLELVCL